jgi:methylglutaconyl-CoA hydratase
MSTFITLERSESIATVTLARPELHNAFNAAMIAELRDCFTALAQDSAVRVVVLAGAGPSFCAGGDLKWMRSSLDWSREQNTADATALAEMFEAAWSLPKPLIGRVHGAAVGGGVGLVACCDIALAADTARFSLSEVKLGLIPAIIAQYVVPKIGIGQARALFVSGERFSAGRAYEIGLVHRVVAAEELDAAVAGLAGQLLSGGPQAIGAAKRLVDAVWTLDREAARRYVIDAIVDARSSAEGQEGMRAFLEKRKPDWGG